MENHSVSRSVPDFPELRYKKNKTCKIHVSAPEFAKKHGLTSTLV